MNTLKDKDGNTWQPFTNEFQQRQLRCIKGAREGDVIHDPRIGQFVGGVSTSDPVKPARDPWTESLYAPPYWE